MQPELSELDIERVHWMTLALRLPDGGVKLKFRSNVSCLNRLAAVRWPSGEVCPKCAGRNIAPKTLRKTYRCRNCKYQFSVTSGTFAHGANIKLREYFLMAEDIIVQNATESSFTPIIGHEFKDRHRVAYETARRLLKLLTDELLLEGGGVIGHCICLKAVSLPQDIEIGSRDHFFWLFYALQTKAADQSKS